MQIRLLRPWETYFRAPFTHGPLPEKESYICRNRTALYRQSMMISASEAM